MKSKSYIAIFFLATGLMANGPLPNPNKSGSLYKNGKWSDLENAKYTFELHKSKKPGIVYQVKTIPARVTFDSSLWKIDSTMAEQGTVSFKLKGQRNTHVSVKVAPRYIKKEDIRKWLLQTYTRLYGKSENKYVNIDEINGTEYHSYFFVNEYNGSHVVTYDMVHSDIQNSLIITTLCLGVDHMKLLPILMQIVSGIEAYNSL